MKKEVYNDEIKLYIMLDLSKHFVDILTQDYREKILNKNVNKRLTHLTFITIIFNNKYKKVKKFLNNESHINKIKKIIKLYFINCIFEPLELDVWGKGEKKNVVKEYKINEKCMKNISFVRKLIYNYIALHIIYKKTTANKLFIKYIKEKNTKKMSCKNIKNKINDNFISFLYKDNNKNKIYDLFSIPKYSMINNELKFHITITDNYEIKKENIELYKKIKTNDIINNEKIKKILLNKTKLLHNRWPKITLLNNFKFFISYF